LQKSLRVIRRLFLYVSTHQNGGESGTPIVVLEAFYKPAQEQ
jgi:hypothetical protein